MFARFLALSVHAFTASGLIFGFLALVATIEGQMGWAFFYLGMALIIDGIDGTFARAAKVKTHTPGVDGVTLDNVIDFFTYVIIPALMVWQWELVPLGWGTTTGCLILLAGGYTYAQAGMKAADNSFVGFPALWNLVVFYIVLLGLGPWAALGLILVCALLTAVPTPYIHPFRTPLFGQEWINWAMVAVWISAASVQAYQVFALGNPATASLPWFIALTVSSAYFALLSFAWPLLRQK